MITRKQYDEIMSLVKDKEQWGKMLKYFKINTIWQMKQEQYEYAKKILQRKKEKNNEKRRS